MCFAASDPRPIGMPTQAFQPVIGPCRAVWSLQTDKRSGEGCGLDGLSVEFWGGGREYPRALLSVTCLFVCGGGGYASAF